MKRFLFALLTWALLSSPALAGAITFVNKSVEVFGAGTSVTMNYPQALSAGAFAAAFLQYGGGNNGMSCVDTQSNSWVNLGFAQGVFAANVQTNYSFLTHAVTTSDSVTCTALSGTTGILGHLGVWSNVNNFSSVNGYAGNATTSAVNSLNTGVPGGNSQCSTGTTGCALIICNAFMRGGGTTQLDAAWTQLTWGTSSNWATGYIIQGNGTPHDCTGSYTGTADRMAIEQLTFNSTTGGGGSTPMKAILHTVP